MGLETLWATVKNDFVSKGDATVAVIHWFLTQNGYKCVGVGENFLPSDESASGSELLPRHWNQDQTGYVLRYVNRSDSSNPKKLTLKVIPHNQTHLFTFFENPGERTAELSLNSGRVFSNTYREYESAFATESSLSELEQQFKNEVLKKLQDKKSPTSSPNPQRSSVGSTVHNRQDPQSRGPRYPESYREPSNDWQQDIRDPFGRPPNTGGADLDPFGRGGMGGMIMDPRDLYGQPRPGRYDPNYGNPNGPRLPPGAVPPGARFDPFGPPPPGPHPNRYRGPRPPGSGFSGPDPDHEKRPDDYDDMFM